MSKPITSTATRTAFCLLSFVAFAFMSLQPSTVFCQTSAVVESGTDFTGRVLVVIDNTPVTGSACGGFFEVEYVDCVFINPGTGPAVLKEVGFLNQAPKPGDRFDVVAQGSCGDADALSLSPLLNTPANIAEGTVTNVQEDDILVAVGTVFSFTDEYGTYSEVDALVLGSGRPDLITLGIYEYTDEPVQPGDRFEVLLADAEGLILVKS